MPGLRYGPDITDDAEVIRKQLDPLKKKATLARKGQASLTTRDKRRLQELKRQITAGFGDEKTMRKFAKYSLGRQGYDASGRTRTVAGVTLRGRPALPKGLRANRGGVSLRTLMNPPGTRELGRKRAVGNAGQKAATARKKSAQKAKKAAKKVKKAAKKTAKRAK
jgi:hypothetical protein